MNIKVWFVKCSLKKLNKQTLTKEKKFNLNAFIDADLITSGAADLKAMKGELRSYNTFVKEVFAFTVTEF
ncbi:hypothetical protein HK099_008301 [Clydaea vesicula]|uniref:Uncharacterized protein n=1 Tax=Clydaea vesicula TaxID=447962 RepID=A0AAD5UBU1_9FUNG|nr:hypothetical protein HK099_008301 [Clydaea vesicula]